MTTDPSPLRQALDLIEKWSFQEELRERTSERLGTHDTLSAAGYVDCLCNLRREIDRLRRLAGERRAPVNPCRCGHEKADHQQRLGRTGNYTPCCTDGCRCDGFRKAASPPAPPEPTAEPTPRNIFDGMPDGAVVQPFNNEQYCGLIVSWSERGTGFGELTISCRKETGEWRVDTEAMGPEWVGNMLMRLPASPPAPPVAGAQEPIDPVTGRNAGPIEPSNRGAVTWEQITKVLRPAAPAPSEQ